MKNFGKMIALILILALTIPMSAFADDNTQYADTLYELGLFKGCLLYTSTILYMYYFCYVLLTYQK